jgi:hypothetical protein
MSDALLTANAKLLAAARRAVETAGSDCLLGRCEHTDALAALRKCIAETEPISAAEAARVAQYEARRQERGWVKPERLAQLLAIEGVAGKVYAEFAVNDNYNALAEMMKRLGNALDGQVTAPQVEEPAATPAIDHLATARRELDFGLRQREPHFGLAFDALLAATDSILRHLEGGAE